MIFNDLGLFVAVAQQLSFSRAADQLGIPLSRVSRKIAALETHLGTRLFERTTRQVRLTEEGRRLLARCQGPFEALQEVTGLAPEGGRQVIKISAPPLAARTTVGRRLLAFAKAYPDVQIELSTTNAMVDFLRDNIDIAFRLGPLKTSSLIARKLWTVPYCFCASPALLAEHGIDGLVTPDALAKLPAVMARQPWLLENGEEIKPIRVSHRFDELELLRDAAAQGLGVAMLPREILTADLHAISITEAEPQTRIMYAVYPSQRLLPMRTRALIDFMVASAESP